MSKSQLSKEETKISQQNLKAILEVAIKTEEQSYALYIMARKKVKYSSSQKFLKELAQEELTHKNRLEREYDEYVLKEN